MKKDAFHRFEEESKVLQAIAGQYEQGSKENSAIRFAGFALLFALTEHLDEFDKFLKEYEQELTDEQKRWLADIGSK